jgi:hypothetical protein
MPTSQINLEKQISDKYIAFIDVLGFSELVSKDDFDLLNSYFETIQSCLASLPVTKEQGKLKHISISDSIIIIGEDNVEDFANLLRTVKFIQQNLAQQGIFCRGAIAFGPVYYSEEQNILVGKGYIKAFNLEKEAINPRIIISPDIILKISDNGKEFVNHFNNLVPKEELLFDKRSDAFVNTEIKPSFNDTATFVNYMPDIIFKSIQQKKFSESDLFKLLEKIKSKMYTQQNIFSKYVWLKDYIQLCLIDAEEKHGNDENIYFIMDAKTYIMKLG